MHKKMIIAVTGFQNFTLSQREERCKAAAHKALLSQSHASSLGFLLGSLRGRRAGDSVRGRGHRAIMGPGVAAAPNFYSWSWAHPSVRTTISPHFTYISPRCGKSVLCHSEIEVRDDHCKRSQVRTERVLHL